MEDHLKKLTIETMRESSTLNVGCVINDTAVYKINEGSLVKMCPICKNTLYQSLYLCPTCKFDFAKVDKKVKMKRHKLKMARIFIPVYVVLFLVVIFFVHNVVEYALAGIACIYLLWLMWAWRFKYEWPPEGVPYKDKE